MSMPGQTTLLEVRRLSPEPRQRRAAETQVALALGVQLARAQLLLAELPARLPLVLAELDAERLLSGLRQADAEVERIAVDHRPPPCVDHERLVAQHACHGCHQPLCSLCAAQLRDARCSRCTAKKDRKRTFFIIRVSILLSILLGVALYAWNDLESRSARKDWSRPISVALVVIAEQPLEADVIDKMRARIPVLEARLEQEMKRHGRELSRPFTFQLFGPVTLEEAPPELPASETLLDSVRFSWGLRRFAGHADSAAGIGSRRFDSVIYVVARPPATKERKAVEGLSQQGGRLGLVKVDLDGTMIDFALFVATHELFHTLGASDKYDSAGTPTLPDGLPEPNAQPQFPQRYAELMARHRAVTATRSVPPDSLSELAVGAQTAHEIGWDEAR